MLSKNDLIEQIEDVEYRLDKAIQQIDKQDRAMEAMIMAIDGLLCDIGACNVTEISIANAMKAIDMGNKLL